MISVCVPYWRRPKELTRMFRNYAELYPELEIEFAIGDDGSPEPAVIPVSGSLAPGHRYVVNRLPAKDYPLNPCVPINAAVAVSTGPFIMLTNAEILHSEPVLPEMMALLQGKYDYVNAPCYDIQRAMWLAGDTVDYTKNGRLPVPPGAHFHFLALFHRTLWEAAGGFDEDYRHGAAVDDNDWVWRAYRAGANFKLSRTPVVHDHPGRGTRWGLPHNAGLFERKWPEAMRAQLERSRQP